MKYLHYAGAAILLASLFAIFAVAVSEVHSFDVFWQLQSGKYMVETKAFIRNDLFTLASESPRYEHTWLHSLILYATYLCSGYAGISVLKGLLVLATAVFLSLAARQRQASFTAISLCLPFYLLTSGGWLERPQLWTFLCFSIFVFALERFSRQPSWWILLLMPLALFWSNAHAGSILSMAILAAYLVGGLGQAIYERRLRAAGIEKLVVLAAGVFAMGLISPYPSKWMSTLLASHNLGAKVDASGKAVGDMTAVYNMDWTPTTFQQEPLFFYAIGVSVFVVLLGWRKIKLSDLCLLAGLALMGQKLVRHIPFFYMGMIAILPVYLDQTIKMLVNRLPELWRKVATAILLCCAVAFFWHYYQPLYFTYGTFKTGLRSWHYPIEATEFVEQHKLPKNIYNTYDWGGYMAWKLFPEYKVFWDGRQTSRDMFKLGWQVMAGRPDWEQILEQFDVRTIVSRASTIDTGQKYPLLDRLRASPDWSLVFNTESSMVFVRNDSVPVNWLKQYTRPKERMDDTILSEAHLMIKYNANRYMAWWEMAQIYTRRKQYKNALFAVQQHLARSPRQSPAAIQLQQQLVMAMKNDR